ncbi:preprotein translocase subunit SecE [Candidatus Latescibacterota bacterium]
MAKITEKTVKYLREVKIELAKVAWPSWTELKGSTILVIILSAFFAIYVGGVDLLLSIVSRVF